MYSRFLLSAFSSILIVLIVYDKGFSILVLLILVENKNSQGEREAVLGSCKAIAVESYKNNSKNRVECVFSRCCCKNIGARSHAPFCDGCFMLQGPWACSLGTLHQWHSVFGLSNL